MSWKGESKRHAMAARGVKSRTVKITQEQFNKMVDNFVDRIIDWLSSGYASSPWDSFYEDGIIKIYNEIPDNMKDDVWNSYIDNINNSGIEYVRDGELEFMSQLFGKEEPKLDYGDWD